MTHDTTVRKAETMLERLNTRMTEHIMINEAPVNAFCQTVAAKLNLPENERPRLFLANKFGQEFCGKNDLDEIVGCSEKDGKHFFTVRNADGVTEE